MFARKGRVPKFARARMPATASLVAVAASVAVMVLFVVMHISLEQEQAVYVDFAVSEESKRSFSTIEPYGFGANKVHRSWIPVTSPDAPFGSISEQV